MSVEMYKIREENVKIQIPCERCVENGIVNKMCFKCGGKGTHYKTLKVWKVHPRTITIDKVDRSKTRDLRYWTDMSTYYPEENKMVHFTKRDAQFECDERNKDILPLLKVYESNRNQPNNKSVYKVGDKFILSSIGVVEGCGAYVRKTTYENVEAAIVKVFEIEGSQRYALSFDKNTVVVTEDSLNELQKI